MKRNILIAVAAIFVATAATWAFWPGDPAMHAEDSHDESDDHGDNHDEEGSLPEGFVGISDQQIEDASIEIESVQLGAAVELVFPATVAAAPSASAQIDARASGVIRSVNKNLGDFVRQGEVIARIESGEAATLASQVAAARARVDELSAIYDRELRLFEANVTARQDLESALANLQVARSELARAQSAVAAAGVSGDGRSLAVTSPISGQVTAAPIVLGSFVAAGDELYRVVNPNGLQVEVALPSADAIRIQPGDDAVLLLGENREIGARVRSVTPALDLESRSATAVLALASSVPGLQPGAFLQARIRPSGEIAHDSISIPEDAVQIIDGQESVFVRTERGFQARPVVAGARSGGRVVIESGLAPGSRIATANAFLLKAELEKEEAEHGH
ncbi:efflux RND transporter periplasmic adaptor subunit [Altererythrobacter salegens]|uniref:Efflux RND transporter periplasmic adaptor subunit n=1 Tax=Croceibacterium salegens TaxID=1737568 RepID=A0A6I4SY48_9SPHN|nr:efflux RND transporter periplasmic adaptor subunit [Croceibacterium salegens]MXO60955.1 efflux RND transporter periplasmic adaptor subunit [Croceibacterium salegens]